MTRVANLVDDESFGMRKMFDYYGFSLNLTAWGRSGPESPSKRTTHPATPPTPQ